MRIHGCLGSGDVGIFKSGNVFFTNIRDLHSFISDYNDSKCLVGERPFRFLFRLFSVAAENERRLRLR